MKAKVIATGEIVNVIAVDVDDTLSVITRYIYKEIDGVREWYDHELFFDIQEDEKSIDWKQRRFELVKIVTQGYLARVNVLPINSKERKMFSELVLDATDAIIDKLKEE